MRWRDIKQGKVKKSETKKRKKQDYISDVGSITDRIKAFITDSFMLTMPIMYIVIYLVMGNREAFEADMAMGWFYILVPHFIIVVGFWIVNAQTPGYKAYELKLVDVNSGKKPDIALLIIRYFFIIISIISIIGLLIAYFRKDRRTLHDLISGTYPKAI